MIHGDVILVQDVGTKDGIGELGASIRANMLWCTVCLNDVLHRMRDFCGTLAFQSPSHQVFRISINAKSMRSMKYMFLLNELMITRVAPFRLAGFLSSLISFINEPLYSMAEKCMEMDEWKKEPQTSGGLEMQGQMSLPMRVQREEWIR